MIFYKTLSSITASDIQSLVESEVPESKILEFKQQLPNLTKTEEKNEFLKDVCAFANSDGGDIIYGLQEKRSDTGEKLGTYIIKPIEGSLNIDQLKQQLVNIIRDRITPRLSIDMKHLNGFGENGSGFVFIIRIPNTFNKPYFIDNKSGVFERTTSGNQQMDSSQLRHIYFTTQERLEKLRAYRDKRNSIIFSSQPELGHYNMLLHILPIDAFSESHKLTTNQLIETNKFMPLNRTPHGLINIILSRRFTVDGMYFCDSLRDSAYCQVGFNGCVEAFGYESIFDDSNTARVDSNGISRTINYFVSFANIKNLLSKRIASYLTGMRELGILSPSFMMFSMHGVKDCILVNNFDQRHTIIDYAEAKYNNVSLLVPELLVENYDESSCESVVSKLLDSIANAFGYIDANHIGQTLPGLDIPVL